MWKEAHASNTFNQDLFDNLTRIHRNETAAANRQKPQTGGQVAGSVSQGKVAPVVQGDVQAAQAKLDAEQAQTDAVKAERADKIAKAVEGHKIQRLRSALTEPNLPTKVRENLETELAELEAKNLNYDDVAKEIQDIEDNDDFFQVTEGAAYPPINDKFPISREDFGRGLGITRHSKTWLATAYNSALADAVTKGDMPAVIRALMDSTNPIVRDIAQRAKVLQQFVPLHRIKIKIADEELREDGRHDADVVERVAPPRAEQTGDAGVAAALTAATAKLAVVGQIDVGDYLLRADVGPNIRLV
jgi:protein required for attachment to host cells